MQFTTHDAYQAPAASAGRTLRICIQLQDALETWYLTRTLEMGAHMAGITARFGVKPADADLVVVAPSESGAVALLQGDAAGADTVVVGYSAAEVPGVRWLPRPARTRDARKLLEAVHARKHHAALGPRAPGALALPFQVVNFQDLLLRLKRGIGNGEPFFIQGGLGFGLVVLPRLNKVCSQVDMAIGDVCDALRPVRLADMRSISDIDAAKRVVESHRFALPLDAVAWELALQAIPLSASRPLLDGMNLRLRALPDFAHLHQNPEHQRWAAMLLQQDLALADLVAASPEGLDPVARFANACSVLGLLEFVASPPAA